jgi:hypothetical protein
MAKLPTLEELHVEIAHLRKHHALPADDQAFVLWYSTVALTGSEAGARNTLVGGPGDVNVDASYIDDANQTVFLVQAKYRTSGTAAENRTDILAFRSVGHTLLGDEPNAKAQFVPYSPTRTPWLRNASPRHAIA